jgi:transposase
MLRTPTPAQHEIEMVTLEELVPQDHLLRLIDQHVDLEFIREETKHLYSAHNGRPAIDPVVLFKMLFIGYLFGVRSERQLVREIQVNVAYRWFLGLRLIDKVPDASTLSQNRRRRFAGTDIEQTIFDRIVEQALGHGLIGGKVLYTDSTHVKANANKGKFEAHQVEQRPQQYLAELNAAIDADRVAHGKAPFKPKDEAVETKEIKVSKTDPDSGYMTREGKPQGFFYLDHRTVDAKHSFIVDTVVTPASVHDSVPYLDRLARTKERFELPVKSVGLDAGYYSAAICKSLVEQDIYGVIGYRRPTHREGYFYKREFIYKAAQDAYVCPQGQVIKYRTTSRAGYREYHSDAKQCAQCPMRAKCTQSANQVKVVTRHVWQEFKEQINAHRLQDKGKKIYARRKETVERSFADAKQLHGYRYAKYRGLARVNAQALLTAACQNMKKMARLLMQALLSLKLSALEAFGVVMTFIALTEIPSTKNVVQKLSRPGLV